MKRNLTWVYIGMVVLMFYIGDLVTTYMALTSGNFYETNILLSKTGFLGTVVLKTIFIICMIIYVFYLQKHNQVMESGIVLGGVIAIGTLMVANNIGFFGG